MVDKFTVEEIRNYIEKQDSMGDILYRLNAENIRKCNLCEICEENKPDYDGEQCTNCWNDINC